MLKFKNEKKTLTCINIFTNKFKSLKTINSVPSLILKHFCSQHLNRVWNSVVKLFCNYRFQIYERSTGRWNKKKNKTFRPQKWTHAFIQSHLFMHISRHIHKERVHMYDELCIFVLNISTNNHRMCKRGWLRESFASMSWRHSAATDKLYTQSPQVYSRVYFFRPKIIEPQRVTSIWSFSIREVRKTQDTTLRTKGEIFWFWMQPFFKK